MKWSSNDDKIMKYLSSWTRLREKNTSFMISLLQSGKLFHVDIKPNDTAATYFENTWGKWGGGKAAAETWNVWSMRDVGHFN